MYNFNLLSILNMIRRNFIKLTSLASLGINSNVFMNDISHYLTLTFDDGFKKSSYRTADIFENYGLKASINIIASGHLKSFKRDPKWMPNHLLGNFNDWNKIKSKGHEIMPHSWEHLNLTKISFKQAFENIDKCLESFKNNLDGFSESDSVFHYPYNSSNYTLDEYLLNKVKAVRAGGWLYLKNKLSNEIPSKKNKLRIGTWSHGPGLCDDYIEKYINDFLNSSGGWLVLNLHGLDSEGWGPISSKYLDKLLLRLLKIDYLSIKTMGEILV